MEDATGDSAIVEHVDGKFQFYHSREEALVMTNEPPYDQQKEILAKYDFMGGNITLPDNLPGTVDSIDRMIRLEYYLTTSPEPKTEAESIAFIRSLISSSNVPFGAPYGGGVYPSWWASFIDVSLLCMFMYEKGCIIFYSHIDFFIFSYQLSITAD